MQDHHTAGDGQASDGTLATVPASVVDCLRRAAYAELGLAAEALDAAAFSTDREAVGSPGGIAPPGSHRIPA